MIRARFLALAALLPTSALAAPAPISLTPADQTAAFRAAGFKKVGTQWQGCGDPGTAGYSPGTIAEVADLDGDGRPEAIVTEDSSYCFGNTGTGYAVVSKLANGAWKLMTGGPGIVTVLKTKGVAGWPDLEIGGPGFCFPVERWNGRDYVLNRRQYEGKPCKG
jgi:hypothetical protein